MTYLLGNMPAVVTAASPNLMGAWRCPSRNDVAAFAQNRARHPRAELQIGVGRVDDGVNVRLFGNVALPDFDFHQFLSCCCLLLQLPPHH
jgi:hypothetical protein